MRGFGPALELRVELGGEIPGVVLELDDLDEVLGGVDPGDRQARVLDELAELVVDLEAMAMAFRDVDRPVGPVRQRPFLQRALIGAQAHGRPHVLDGLLLGEEVDHGIAGLRVELGRVRARKLEDVP